MEGMRVSGTLGLLSLAGLALLAIFWRPLHLGLQRMRLRRQAFPGAWRVVLRQQVPLVARLPANLQLRLKRHIQVFLAEVPFIGCRGLEVTEAMRVVVAAQACLLQLHRRVPVFPALRQVLLYPGSFVVQRSHTDEAGLQRDERQALAGESWTQGQVILAWDAVQAGAADPGDGHNVVIHEFAHQWDQAHGGQANGAPWMPGARRRARWAATLQAAFVRLQADLAAGRATPIDPYGATSPAEFFAVLSELFFEAPAALAGHDEALYEAFCGYYGVRPLVW